MNAVRAALRGPIGRATFDVYGLDPAGFHIDARSRRVVPSDLARLHDMGLLAERPDHQVRLRRGDVGLMIEEAGDPVAVVWMNLVGHADAYAGRWSRPDPETGYLNQLLVHPDHRGRGCGKLLVAAACASAAQAHRTRVSVIIQPTNAASIALFRGVGATRLARIQVFRAGPMSVRLPRSATSL